MLAHAVFGSAIFLVFCCSGMKCPKLVPRLWTLQAEVGHRSLPNGRHGLAFSLVSFCKGQRRMKAENMLRPDTSTDVNGGCIDACVSVNVVHAVLLSGR